MERIKEFVFRHFEALVVLSVFGGVLTMHLLVVHQASFLHFYFLPALLAGYVLGLRAALLTSLLSIAFLVFFMQAASEPILGSDGGEAAFTIGVWGGFLILTSAVTGVLYEKKEKKVRELHSAYVGVLEILSKYIESNDRYTLGHSMRVSQMAAAVAERMGLSRRMVENCRVGGLLHDIGKVEISLDLIRKASALTEAERAEVATHAERGARMIDSLGGILQEVVPVIEMHHLHYKEGGMEGTALPIESQIISVADTYDAIVTDRPYRAGRPPVQAFAELEKGSGTQFSPKVLQVFREVMADKLYEVEAVTVP
ncbi:MAG: HD domain-containing protein [Candidatus Eisenbacteria bacterium]|nr:HD domain-containing protein [Candidatus Eisenbacteria bacterium]